MNPRKLLALIAHLLFVEFALPFWIRSVLPYHSHQILKAEGSFGDIMSGGLSTEATTTLAQRYGIKDPLDRMALTANGNLQRLVSSYYDSPVTVKVESCVLRGDRVWDRVVKLIVHGKAFCTATSVVTVYSDRIEQMVESEEVGLGQVFRYLNVLPEFYLHDAGLLSDGGLWRNYTLSCPEISCQILEEFSPDTWKMNR